MSRLRSALYASLALLAVGARQSAPQSTDEATPPVAVVDTAGDATVAQDARPPSEFAAVLFPAVVDSFTNVRITQQPNRLAGVTARYSSSYFERAIVDVYLYPVLPGQDTLGSEEAIARAEYERSREEVMAFRDAPGQPDAPELLSEDSITVEASDGRVYRGWRAELFVSMGNERPRSHLYVFRKDGGTVKFRISHPRELQVFMAPHLDAFIRQSLEQVRVDPVWAQGRPAQDPFAAELGDGWFSGIGFPMRVDSVVAMAVASRPNGEIDVQYASPVDRRFQASVRLRPAPGLGEELIRAEFLPRALELRASQLRAATVPDGATLEFQVEAVTDVALPDGSSVPVSRVEILASTEAGAIHSHFFDFSVGPVQGQLRFGHDQLLGDRLHPSIEGVLQGILLMARAGG